MAETGIKVQPFTEQQQDAFRKLMKHQRKIDRNEYRTLFGLIMHDRTEAAMHGLTTILSRDLEKNFWKTHKRRVR